MLGEHGQGGFSSTLWGLIKNEFLENLGLKP